MSRNRWTEVELTILRRYYPDYITRAIADALGRTERQVYSKAKALGLKKSEAYLASPQACRLRRGDNTGAATRFQKGHVPANKGTRRPGWAPGRMAETQFKPGRPAIEARNYVPIGSTRVTRDGILERKVTDDPSIVPARRWVPVTRLVWEAVHGPVPPKHVVRFLPGTATTIEAEITIDRLECISLAENMRRNTLHRYPKEIGDAIRARAVLNRRINHVEKHQ